MITPMRKTLVFAAILLFTGAASAQQYKWVDKDGKVRYGDVPPPGANATRMKPPAAASAPAPAPAAKKDAAKAPKQAEKQQLTEEQTQMKRENCARAQESLRTLESGQRISRIDSKGERYFLDEGQIAQETAKARQSVGQWCS